MFIYFMKQEVKGPRQVHQKRVSSTLQSTRGEADSESHSSNITGNVLALNHVATRGMA